MRATNISDRYIRNIENTQRFRQNPQPHCGSFPTRKIRQIYIGNFSEMNRLASAQLNGKYSHSVYMGLSNG